MFEKGTDRMAGFLPDGGIGGAKYDKDDESVPLGFVVCCAVVVLAASELSSWSYLFLSEY